MSAGTVVGSARGRRAFERLERLIYRADGPVDSRILMGQIVGCHQRRSRDLHADVGWEVGAAGTKALSRLTVPDMPAWDVGAFIGYWTIFLARRSSIVLAVEPDAVNAARVAGMIELNKLNAELVEAAVIDTDGETFFQDGLGPVSTIGTDGVRVRTVTLDSLLELTSPPRWWRRSTSRARRRSRLRGRRGCLPIIRRL